MVAVGRYPLIVLVGLLLLGVVSCNKKDCDCVPPPTEREPYVLTVCEGSLGNGNSSLSAFPASYDGDVREDIYREINGQSLGDIFQSMTLIGDRYFLCINNSDRIIVLNKNTLKREGVIIVSKPRYILPISNDRAYVSTLFSKKIYIINPGSLQVLDSVTLPHNNPEGMLLQDGSAYVCAWDTASQVIYKLNTATNQVAQTIPIAGRAPQEVVVDKQGMLWVLSGNVSSGKTAAFTRINPANGQTVASYTFPAGADPIRPVFNAAKDTLYFLEVNYNGGTQYNGVFRMPITATSLPVTPFVAAQQYQYFWALGIDPKTNLIYIGDPKGFIQRGSVLVYNPAGEKQREVKVGVGPGHFYFE